MPCGENKNHGSRRDFYLLAPKKLLNDGITRFSPGCECTWHTILSVPFSLLHKGSQPANLGERCGLWLS